MTVKFIAKYVLVAFNSNNYYLMVIYSMPTFNTYKLIASLLLLVLSHSPSVMATPLHSVEKKLTINKKVLTVEVAQTLEQRQQGLMNRIDLADGRGMLFDFGEEVTPCFWMKNTTIALSLAYINSDYTITQIEPLMPQDLKSVCSKIAIRYAIEVPQGWFTKQGIKEGMFVEGINHP